MATVEADFQMTPAELRQIREAAHLTRRGLSRLLGRNEASLRQMEAGRIPVPGALAEWLVRLGEWVEANPPPPKSR